MNVSNSQWGVNVEIKKYREQQVSFPVVVARTPLRSAVIRSSVPSFLRPSSTHRPTFSSRQTPAGFTRRIGYFQKRRGGDGGYDTVGGQKGWTYSSGTGSETRSMAGPRRARDRRGYRSAGGTGETEPKQGPETRSPRTWAGKHVTLTPTVLAAATTTITRYSERSTDGRVAVFDTTTTTTVCGEADARRGE